MLFLKITFFSLLTAIILESCELHSMSLKVQEQIVESLLPCLNFFDIQSNTIRFPLKIVNQIT